MDVDSDLAYYTSTLGLSELEAKQQLIAKDQDRLKDLDYRISHLKDDLLSIVDHIASLEAEKVQYKARMLENRTWLVSTFRSQSGKT